MRQGIAEGDRVRVYFSGAGQADLQGTVLYMPQATGDCWIIETERTVEHVQTFARIAKDKTHDIHSLSPKDK